jgi:hypothetical protein
MSIIDAGDSDILSQWFYLNPLILLKFFLYLFFEIKIN